MPEDDALQITVYPSKHEPGRGSVPQHEVFIGKKKLGVWHRPWLEVPLHLLETGMPLDRVIDMRWSDASASTVYTTLARATGRVKGPGTAWHPWYREVPLRPVKEDSAS